MQTTKHIPVMLEQSINGMNIQKKGIYIDATYGFGGHSNKILSLLDDEGRLFAVDKDINSIINNLKEFNSMAKDEVLNHIKNK